MTAPLPAQVLDLADWKLTLPVGVEVNKPTEIKQPRLAGYFHASYFHAVDGPAVLFRAPVNGVTTSGSPNPRSELREMNADGSNASWSSTDGQTHVMTLDQAFTHLPNARTDGGTAAVVAGQIHDADDDICVFRLEGSNLWLTNGDDTHFKLITDSYVLGTRFTATFVVRLGLVDAYYNGTLIGSIPMHFSGGYFKAGAYTQANSKNSKPNDVSNYGEVLIYKLVVSHGVAVPDPTPAPVPPPATGNTPGTPGRPGVGGVPTPSNAVLATADSTAARVFSEPGVYDGQGHTIGRVTAKAGVTVQNYRIKAGGQYGAVLDGDNACVQNCDVKGIKQSGDGDLNAFTWFGNGIRIFNNTAEDYVEGNPGGSHTDGAQTWVSSSHPTASSDVQIRGNRFTGPDNPKRSNSVPSIHQCVMAEDFGRGGNSGGSSSGMKNWVIADNYFKGSWNQEIKLDGVDNVDIMRNTFAGSSDKIMDVPQGSNVKFYEDNKITGQYKNGIGIPVTKGAGPGSPGTIPSPVPDPVPVPTPTPAGPVIMIIRHGEKDDDHDGTDDVSHGLSKRGQQRALAIRDRGLFITPRADLAVPTYVLASQGGRMEQTARPTADALKLPIDVSLDVETAIDATAKLLVAKAKAGHIVWAVVEHGAIPPLLKSTAKQLGCTDELPSSHADDDFHTGYAFRGPKFSIWQESVLPGDPGYQVPPVVVDPPPVVVDPPPVVIDPPPVVVDPPPVVVDPPPVVVDPPPVVVVPPPPAPTPKPTPAWVTQLLAWLRRVFS